MRLLRIISRAAVMLLFGVLAFIAYDRHYTPKPTVPKLAPLTQQIDYILVEKAARKLTVFQNDKPLRSYKIALGFSPAGDKQVQGDGKTPEGIFTINRRNPSSSYHLSLGIDYPQAEDVARAQSQGIDPGGDIFIHGQPNATGKLATIGFDWTAGCIAVSDAEIEELWRVVQNGTVVEIKP